MKVFLDSVGCKLNQSEIERMAYQLRQAGHSLVATPEESNLVVINTCSVTAAAAADSRSVTRRAHRRNRLAQIVLTGCWSDLEPQAAIALPGVTQVIPNEEKDRLIQHVLGLPTDALDWKPLERLPIPGTRRRTRAFIKVQDGCDNSCTFCLATIARGPSHSQPIDHVIDEIRSAIAGEVQEVVLTGAQLSAYGRDLSGGVDLTTLLHTILTETEIPRARLSSMEPWGIPDGLFSIIQNPRVCRHLHLPLQSGCDRTLRRMGRLIRSEDYARIVTEAREAIPDLAITTDVMVGFPGETEGEFAESLAFIEAMRFARAHVFVYSPRPGTAAVQLPNRVPHQVARKRSRQVREVVARSGSIFRTKFVGEVMPVLWESASASSPKGWEISGLTDNYLRVKTFSDQNIENSLADTHIIGVDGVILYGELVPSLIMLE